MELLSRKEAIEKGLTTYFNNSVCKRGHISKRYTRNHGCVQCEYERSTTEQSRKYQNEYYLKNKERIYEYQKTIKDKIREDAKIRYHKNPEKFRALTKKWSDQNKQRHIENTRRAYFAKHEEYKAKHRERAKTRFRTEKGRNQYRQYATIRNKRLKNATPDWLTDDMWYAINLFYEQARDCSRVSCDDYEVDHIVPLAGKNVCGLHVPWNLQVLPKDLNRSKLNVFKCV